MKKILFITALIIFSACNRSSQTPDATGNFEADEVIVSAELSGKILSLNIEEGDSVPENKIIGAIDALDVTLQKDQVQASIEALGEKTSDVAPQIKLLEEQLAVQQSQLANLQHEEKRTENLVRQDAATGKQLDDINAQIDVVQKQMNVTQQQINVQKSNVATQNRGILSEQKPLAKKEDELNNQLKKASIVNPVAGTVLTKYAMAGEITAPGKALYKIANLSSLILRAYITGAQLPQVRLGQNVTVLIDSGQNKSRQLPGVITWISGKAEFTPKTIQTKDERANLVYAIKINVKNDGYLKIGMYGEVKF